MYSVCSIFKVEYKFKIYVGYNCVFYILIKLFLWLKKLIFICNKFDIYFYKIIFIYGGKS